MEADAEPFALESSHLRTERVGRAFAARTGLDAQLGDAADPAVRVLDPHVPLLELDEAPGALEVDPLAHHGTFTKSFRSTP